ncbi:MAG: UbiA family prenyltransferase, partial [Planctomycetota bacterium]
MTQGPGPWPAPRRISPKTAIAEAMVFFLAALAAGAGVSIVVLAMVLMFMALQVSYTLALKREALLDVICIALGFVLRAGSGVAAIRGEVSPWLFICMFTICLFMGFCKRYNEVVTLQDKVSAENHRP